MERKAVRIRYLIFIGQLNVDFIIGSDGRDGEFRSRFVWKELLKSKINVLDISDRISNFTF